MKVLLTENEIAARIAQLGGEITEAYRGKELTVIVMMNGTDKQLDVDMNPYKEILEPGNALRDVITGETITIIPKMTFEPRALYILE